MTSNESNTAAATEAASSKPKAKEPQYRMDPAAIPTDLRQTVAAKLSPEADVYPAKDGGNYKGRVIHADENFIVQAIGKSEKTAVVHSRDQVDIKGASLLSRDANNDLPGRNVQIHYDDDGKSARMYPYNPVKEAEAKEAGKQERQASMVDRIKAAAVEYATENMPAGKSRNAFLQHFENVMTKAAPEQARSQEAPQQQKPAPAREH